MKNLILALAAVFAFTFSSTAAAPKEKVGQKTEFRKNHPKKGAKCNTKHRKNAKYSKYKKKRHHKGDIRKGKRVNKPAPQRGKKSPQPRKGSGRG